MKAYRGRRGNALLSLNLGIVRRRVVNFTTRLFEEQYICKWIFLLFIKWHCQYL